MWMEMPFEKEMPYGTYIKKTETAIRRKIKTETAILKYNIGMENYVRIYATNIK